MKKIINSSLLGATLLTGGIFLANISAHAQIQVVFDDWSNGSLTNTGPEGTPANATNYWQSNVTANSEGFVNLNTETGRPQLFVNQQAGSTISASLRMTNAHNYLNFFATPLQITMTGVTYTAESTDSNVFMIALASEGGFRSTDAGNNGGPQQFGIRIRPNERFEVGARDSTAEGLFSGANQKQEVLNSGVVLDNTTIELTLDATNYIVRFINPNDPLDSIVFQGQHGLSAEAWGEEASIGFLNQSFGSGLDATVSFDSISIVAVPEPAAYAAMMAFMSLALIVLKRKRALQA